MLKRKGRWTRWMLCAGSLCALAAAAFPPRAELDAAQKIVEEIMSPDVAAFKAKSKTAADVASAALGYADEAQGEAAKFLLLKGAFFFQMRAANYDGAKDTIGRIRGEIAAVPDKVVADMLSSALRRVPRKHCGQLYEMLQRTQNRVRYAQEAHALAQQAKAKPTDRALLVRLGERYALLGDWERAIASFAAGEGKLAEMAQWERKYPATGITDLTTAKVADFWWEAGGDDEERTRAYRVHAAYWYRKAIENNAVPGLKKTLAEKRIAEAEKDLDTVFAPVPSCATGPAAQPTLASKAAVGKGGPQPPPKTLRLGGGVDIEFIGCPAGSFMMGDPKDDSPRSAYRYHKVNITRPFWLSKFKVTHGMWNAYQKVQLTKEDNALGGMKRVHCVRIGEAEAFCEWVTKRFRSNLPRGYVVRLPTEAEWEYAYDAGVTDQSDPYVRLKSLGWGLTDLTRVPDEFAAIMVWWETDVEPKLKAAGILDVNKPNPAVRVCGTAVGTKLPNAWGLYDMVGNLGEALFDRVDCNLLKRIDGQPFVGNGGVVDWRNQDAIRTEDGESDPVRWAVGGHIRNLQRGGTSWVRWRGSPRTRTPLLIPHAFRLCIGPDLMKEKGLKK